MSVPNRSTRPIVVLLAMACVLPVAAQTTTLTQPASQPVRTAPLATQPRVRLLPPNITRWGIVERQGGQVYGKTGQTIFVEGRDLDPKTLVLELRDGARAVPFPRRAGGSSARVEFTIPPQAVTGDLTYTLQAVQGGARVLATDFGVCDRVEITAVTPSEILFNPRSANVNQEYSVSGKILTLVGSCLHEVAYAKSKNRDALQVGTPAGALTIAREVSRSFGRIVLELDTYVPASRSAGDSRGPIRLANPQTGPVMAVASRSQAPADPTPEAVPLSVIRVDRFESLQTWGGATTAAVPFVVTQTDTDDLASAGRPKLWTNFIRVSGENLVANPGTQWRIGEVAIPGNVTVDRANATAPPQVRFAVPANTVTAPVCAVRRDGARFCSKPSLPVVAGPRILQVPAGWPRNGNLALGEQHLVTARVRQVHAITGFDLVPRGVPDLTAELVVRNQDEPAARACNLDFRVLRLDPTRIEFSFGAPGTSRPAGCTAEQEQQVNFMRAGSVPTSADGGRTLPGRIEVALHWVYQGRRELIAAWNAHGSL